MPVQMELSRIIISEINDQQVVFLREVEGTRSFPILIGMFGRSPRAAVLASLGMILGAYYLLWMLQRVLFGLGPLADHRADPDDDAGPDPQDDAGPVKGGLA